MLPLERLSVMRSQDSPAHSTIAGREACQNWTFDKETDMPYQLPPLPYAFNALEPHIDARTMEIHHDKHHAAYVTNLNKAVENTEFDNQPIEQLLRNIDKVPEKIRTAVRNHGGGHANHSMFWTTMGSGK